MNNTITTTLSQKYYKFLDDESKKNNISKKEILETALELYQKQLLESQIKQWLSERYDEYHSLNNDFDDVQFNSIR